MSSSSGSEKKRNRRSRTRTWIRRFVEACRRTRTILPATTTIERLCADALVDAERRIEARIAERVPPGLRRDLELLLEETADAGVTRFVWLRQFEPGSNSADANRLLDRLEHLQRLDVPEGLFHENPSASDHAAAPAGGALLRRRAPRAPGQPPPRDPLGLRRRVGDVPRRRGGGDPRPARRRTYREATRACEAQLGDETAAVREALRAFAELGRAQIDRAKRAQIARLRDDAELAQRQFLLVKPEHRLVADNLERHWNEALQRLAEAEEAYAGAGKTQPPPVTPELKERVAALVSDLPRVWHNPRTPARDRKRMLRLLVEDVTLLRDDVIRLSIRWRGGATRQLECPLPLSAPDLRRTPAAVVEQVRALATEQTDAQVAETLNRRWLRTGTGLPFSDAATSLEWVEGYRTAGAGTPHPEASPPGRSSR